MGYLSGGGVQYSDGTPRGFLSDINPAADYNAVARNCIGGFANTFAIAKAEPIANLSCGENMKVPFRDHTPGLGGEGFAYFIDYNGSAGATNVIWAQNVNMYPNETYYFSAWFAKYTSSTGWTGTLKFYVTGNVSGTREDVATASLVDGQMVWKQFEGEWDANTNTSALLEIEFLALGGSNVDDIVMDDISFINSCQNLSADISYRVETIDDVVSLCYENGAYDAQLIRSDNGLNV